MKTNHSIQDPHPASKRNLFSDLHPDNSQSKAAPFATGEAGSCASCLYSMSLDQKDSARRKHGQKSGTDQKRRRPAFLGWKKIRHKALRALLCAGAASLVLMQSLPVYADGLQPVWQDTTEAQMYSAEKTDPSSGDENNTFALYDKYGNAPYDNPSFYDTEDFSAYDPAADPDSPAYMQASAENEPLSADGSVSQMQTLPEEQPVWAEAPEMDAVGEENPETFYEPSQQPDFIPDGSQSGEAIDPSTTESFEDSALQEEQNDLSYEAVPGPETDPSLQPDESTEQEEVSADVQNHDSQAADAASSLSSSEGIDAQPEEESNEESDDNDLQELDSLQEEKEEKAEEKQNFTVVLMFNPGSSPDNLPHGPIVIQLRGSDGSVAEKTVDCDGSTDQYRLVFEDLPADLSYSATVLGSLPGYVWTSRQAEQTQVLMFSWTEDAQQDGQSARLYVIARVRSTGENLSGVPVSASDADALQSALTAGSSTVFQVQLPDGVQARAVQVVSGEAEGYTRIGSGQASLSVDSEKRWTLENPEDGLALLGNILIVYYEKNDQPPVPPTSDEVLLHIVNYALDANGNPTDIPISGSTFSITLPDGSTQVLQSDAQGRSSIQLAFPQDREATASVIQSSVPAPYLGSSKSWSLFLDGQLQAQCTGGQEEAGCYDPAANTLYYYNPQPSAPSFTARPGFLTVHKLDARDHRPLAGAVFALMDGQQVLASSVSREDGTLSFELPASWSGRSLVLQETRAPEGYQKTEKSWQIAVESDASVQNADVTDIRIDGQSAGVQASLQVENEPLADPDEKDQQIQLQLVAHKILENGELQDGQFTFLLQGDQTSLLATNNKEGTVIFAPLVFTSDDIGTIWHGTLQEVPGADTAIEYDTRIWSLEVQIHKSADGQLVLEIAITAPDGSTSYGSQSGSGRFECAAGIEFVNVMQEPSEMQPASVVIEARKVLEGMDLEAGLFDFQLLDANGKAVAQATNGADGSIVFEAMHFEQEGTYDFFLQEVSGTIAGMEYDDNRIPFSVQVVKDQDAYTASVQYAVDPVFTNRYTPAEDVVIPAIVHIDAIKLLDGRPAQGSDFQFGLYSQSGTLLYKAVNQDMQISFGPLTFEKAGQYACTIQEIPGAQSDIVYDPAIYTAAVVVSEEVIAQADMHQGTGRTVQLQAEVTWYKNGSAHSGALVFENQTAVPDERQPDTGSQTPGPVPSVPSGSSSVPAGGSSSQPSSAKSHSNPTSSQVSTAFPNVPKSTGKVHIRRSSASTSSHTNRNAWLIITAAALCAVVCLIWQRKRKKNLADTRTDQ